MKGRAAVAFVLCAAIGAAAFPDRCAAVSPSLDRRVAAIERLVQVPPRSFGGVKGAPAASERERTRTSERPQLGGVGDPRATEPGFDGGKGAPGQRNAEPRLIQEPPAPQSASQAQLKAAIDKLGDLDYATRTAAARTVRRTAGAQAVPALLQAAADHRDGYVRYRALVLLTGFNDVRTKDAMREAMASPNDRLRAAAYGFFEHNPDPAMAPDLLAALDREGGEFVRPALVRALAAAARADDARVRETLVRDVGRGQDFFRSAVIEALGDYKAAYAFDALIRVAKLEGPLQGDAALSLGKIGDKRALETLAAVQRTAPRPVQPRLAAAICLLGVNCGTHENYLIETLRFSDRNIGFQPLLRSAAAGLGALGVVGRESALQALFDIGIPSRDPTRAPVALAVAMIALRNTPLFLSFLAKYPDRTHALELAGEGFDMLEEDLDKERFFAVVRRTYWQSAGGSPTRSLMQTLITKLDF